MNFRNKFFLFLILLIAFISVTIDSESISDQKIVINENTPKITLNVYGRDVEGWVVSINGKKYIVSMTYFGCYSFCPL